MRVPIPKLFIGIFIGAAMMSAGLNGLSTDLQTNNAIQLPVAKVAQRRPKKAAVQPNTKPRPTAVSVPPQRKSVWIVADRTLVQLGETINLKLEPEQAVAQSRYRFSFTFNDGSARETKLPGQPVRHRFASAGAHTVSAFAEDVAGLGPDEEGIDPITINVERVKLSASPLSTEVGIPVLLQATSVSKDPNLRYRFTFGDDKPTTDWQESNKARHGYSAVAKYQPKVEVGLANGTQVVPMDSNVSAPVNVVLPQAGAVLFRVNPPRVKSDEAVTLSAEFPAKQRHIQYRFVFGDSQTSEWKDEPLAIHNYTAGGWYEPSVEVGVVLDGTVYPLITAAPQRLEVIATHVVVPPLSQNSDRNEPSSKPDWPFYLIVILVFVVVLTSALVVSYKAVKWVSTPKPTFVSHIDVGSAAIDQVGFDSLVKFEIDLNPNVAKGSYEVFTSEPRLVRAERSYQ
jgi:hypothetical protein